MSTIYWLDDNMTTTRHVGDSLRSSGYDVTTETTWTATVTPSLFDLVVVDLYLDVQGADGLLRTASGLDVFGAMLEFDPALAGAIEQGSTRLLFLSQHLVEFPLRARLLDFARRYRIRAYLRAKATFQSDDIPRRDALARTISAVLEGGQIAPPLLEEELEGLVEPDTSDSFFTIELAEYRSLSEVQQAELQERAVAQVGVASDKLFAAHEEVDWLLYCGDSDRPLSSGVFGEVPSTNERREIAEANGTPALLITRPTSETPSSRGEMTIVEESGPGPFRRLFPGGRHRGQDAAVPSRPATTSAPEATTAPIRCPGRMSTYPTVTLELADKRRTYHFDSGAETTFLRASHVREHGQYLAVEDRVNAKSHRGKFWLYELEALECTLYDQWTGGEYGVAINGWAIEEYKNWNYARYCSDHGCDVSGEVGVLCAVRSGLVGRSFLYDNQLAITLTSEHEATQVARTGQISEPEPHDDI